MSEAADQAHEAACQIARRLSYDMAPGWLRMEVELALAGPSQSFKIIFNYGNKAMQVQPSDAIVALVREQRKMAARTDNEPWWRMLLKMTYLGDIDVSYDYGDKPFPDDQLLPPEAYLADLKIYPRELLPIWMSAYLYHGDRQKRSPRQASEEARANRIASHWPVLVLDELPDFPVMWARWAIIAAAFVAVGSDWGPRILPGLAWFEGSRRSGCTLYSLPGDRAVLSGGLWDARSLDAAYNDGLPLPNLFKGAPEWVADPVLNPRTETGLLSFCYWWEGGSWYRGESPSVEEFATAMPGVWTADTVAGIIKGLAGHSDAQKPEAVETLVSTAQQGLVTRDAFTNIFGDGDDSDIDSALYQLSLAGLMYASSPDAISRDQAFSRVRQYIESEGFNVAEYPFSQMTAERLGTGWRFYLPVQEGNAATGQEIFYVDDDGDGLIERTSSLKASVRSVANFERRFRKRHSPGF